MKGNFGSIDDDDSSCHGYYIIKCSSSPNTFHADLSIHDQVISSGDMVCEGTNFFLSISILISMFYKKIDPIIQLYLKRQQ